MSKKTKIFAGVVLGIAILLWAVTHFGSAGPEPTTGLVSSVKSDGSVAKTNTNGAVSEFSTLLSSIKSIDIDTSIFENVAYRALRDSPIVLGTETVGRINPFAPVGNDAQTYSSATTVQAVVPIDVVTFQPGKVTSSTAEFGAQASLPNPAGASVVFEYGESDTFGNITTQATLSKNGNAITNVTNLSPGTIYYVRAVLVQGSNTTVGNTMTFTTLAAPKSR